MSTRGLLRLLLLLCVLFAFVACSSTPSAPRPKSYPALPSKQVKLEYLWDVQVGKGLAEDHVRLAPAVGEQHIVAASRDGVLLVLERETGKVLWEKKTGLPVTAGPAAAYGLVVVATAKGDVVAFAEEDGTQKWTVSVGAAVVAAPALSTDTVVVLAADGVVHALARDTGEARWTYNTMVPPLSLHGNAAPLIVDNHVFVATSAGKLLAFDLITGVAGLELRVATNTGRSELERMTDIVGNLLLLDNRDLYSVGFQSQLTAVDVESGRRRWQFDVSSVQDMAEGLGNVYVTDTSANVFAVDRASGKVVWKQPDYAYRTLTAPTIVGGLVAFGDGDGKVHLLAQTDGSVRGRISTGFSLASGQGHNDEVGEKGPMHLGYSLASVQGRDDMLYTWSSAGVLVAWKIRPAQ